MEKNLFLKKKWLLPVGITVVVLVLLILVFARGNTSPSSANPGISISTDNNIITNKDSISTDKIVMEKVGITKSGDFVIKVTNNNTSPVCIATVYTIFKDENNTFVEKVESSIWGICLSSNSSTLIYNDGYGKNFDKYPNYEFECELAYYDSTYSEDFIFDGLNISSKNTGKQIAVTITNNSGRALYDCEIVVAYYKDSKIVGIESATSDGITNNNSNAYLTVDYAEDKHYNNVSFDTYEIYYIGAEVE